MFNKDDIVEPVVLDTLCGGVISNMVVEELAVSCGAYNRNQGGLLHGI